MHFYSFEELNVGYRPYDLEFVEDERKSIGNIETWHFVSEQIIFMLVCLHLISYVHKTKHAFR